MNNRWTNSLHIRVIFVFVNSLLLSIITSAAISAMLYNVYKNSYATDWIAITMHKYYYSYGLSPFILALVTFFHFVYFLWLFRKWSIYFTKVESVTKALSEGRFEVEIPKQSKNTCFCF